MIYDHPLPRYSVKSFKPSAPNFEGFVCIDLFEVGGLFCIIRNVIVDVYYMPHLMGAWVPYGWSKVLGSLTNITCNKSKAQKKATFLWSVIHKAVAVNEWHGRMRQRLTRVVFIVAHNQWSTHSLAAHLLNKCGVMLLTSCGNSLSKEVTLDLGNLFQWCKCLFDQPLCMTLKQLSHIWLYLQISLPWIIWVFGRGGGSKVLLWHIAT